VDDYRSVQLQLGDALFEALAAGKAWISDEAKLRRLKSMNRVQSLEYGAERYLENWQRPRLELTILCDPSFVRAYVAHYHFESWRALKEKLAQFAPGTKFALSQLGKDCDQQCIADVREFLQNHGMSLEDEKPAVK
jgi:hypothetical protein